MRLALALPLVLALSACTDAHLQRAECALDAVKALPLERPEQATAADARDAAERFVKCSRGEPDGGGQ